MQETTAAELDAAERMQIASRLGEAARARVQETRLQAVECARKRYRVMTFARRRQHEGAPSDPRKAVLSAYRALVKNMIDEQLQREEEDVLKRIELQAQGLLRARNLLMHQAQAYEEVGAQAAETANAPEAMPAERWQALRKLREANEPGEDPEEQFLDWIAKLAATEWRAEQELGYCTRSVCACVSWRAPSVDTPVSQDEA